MGESLGRRLGPRWQRQHLPSSPGLPPAFPTEVPLRPSLLLLGGAAVLSSLLCGPRPQLQAAQALLTCPFLFQVPQIYWEMSTKRVLLMEFVDGGQVNDRDYMEKNKIDVNQVRLRAHSCGAGDTGFAGAAQQGKCVQVRSHCLERGLLSEEL